MNSKKNLNVPNLRFPEFVRELSLKKLEEISTWASGGTPSKENASFWNGTIPWISASSMHGVEYSNSNLKITEEGLKSGSKLAKKNTLLLLVRGSMLFNRIPVGITTKDVAFNQDVKSILIDDKKGNAKYILYWFFHSEQRIKHLVTGTGIGAGKLDMSDLKSLKVKLPTIPEQIKIATFLTSIDERINTQSKIIEDYKLLKKGIMQKIFNQELRFKDEKGNDFPEWNEKKISEIFEVT
ncbi:restriction endonuclease subunit S, partial [Labilibaculum sp.]|uniref:restriction endonuclease subunit S n=1 Tax=Labilibaculum sp. TaxID=2060723 RepID=UPI003564E418